MWEMIYAEVDIILHTTVNIGVVTLHDWSNQIEGKGPTSDATYYSVYVQVSTKTFILGDRGQTQAKHDQIRIF